MLSEQNPSIGKAVGILKTLSGDEAVRMEAFYREKELRDKISWQNQAIEQGMEKGIKQGMEQSKLKITANLLTMGLSIEQIKNATGLTEEEILSLKSN
jgi:predicted transposase/invertase (TIGR01784 family)